MNVVLLPLPRSDQPTDLKTRDVAYISKRKTIKDLGKKLVSAYSPFFSDSFPPKTRIGKLDPHLDLNAAWEKWNGGNQFEIHGTILNDETSIEVLSAIAYLMI